MLIAPRINAPRGAAAREAADGGDHQRQHLVDKQGRRAAGTRAKNLVRVGVGVRLRVRADHHLTIPLTRSP